MRTLASLLIISCLGFLAACTLLVEVKDPPDDNTNNANNAQCGNGSREGSEACDGSDLGDTTCSALSLGEGTLSCNANCTFNTGECTSSYCGDGFVSAEEQCDGADLGGHSCETIGFEGGSLSCAGDCTLDTSGCDGSAVEICDDELDNDGDGYTDCDDSDCATHSHCTNCGNGAIDNDEECDAGQFNGLTCQEFGFEAGPLGCNLDGCRYDFSPCTPFELTNVRKVVTGESHTCALTMDGLVFCWGDNTFGQVGISPVGLNFFPTPVQVGELFLASDLAAGASHTCAIADVDGTGTQNGVFCWGANHAGQTGQSFVGGHSHEPMMVSGVNSPMQVVAGTSHTCARLASTMVCWGANSYGQLGDPAVGATGTTTPVTSLNLTGLLQITAGGNNTCAITTQFDVYCWGQNDQGQVGDNTPDTSKNTPTRVYNSFTANYISTGGTHTCAIATGASVGVFCWGANDHGQLGLGSPNGNPTLIPTEVLDFGTTTATEVEAGFASTCARAGTGLFCWGLNGTGQLGIDEETTPVPDPTEVSLTGQSFFQVSQPTNHACAVLGDKTVWCWGFNFYGQLGNASRQDTWAPVRAGAQ